MIRLFRRDPRELCMQRRGEDLGNEAAEDREKCRDDELERPEQPRLIERGGLRAERRAARATEIAPPRRGARGREWP
jgi:hypothetical protein